MRHRRRCDAFRSFGKGSLTVSTTVALLAFVATPAAARIDRQALVTRHMVRQTRIDPHAPVMLGNGQLGFTADITGLQSFPDRYSELAPLLTMAQWGWHSFPNPTKVRERDGWRMIPVEGRGSQPYAWMQSWADGEKNPAYGWLRANPHRISLGRIALALGEAAPDFADVTETRQQLDLWTGRLTSEFRLRGTPVRVTTVVHPTIDLVAVEIVSPLVARGELGATVRYPGVAPAINPDPSGWTPRATETTRVLTRTARSVALTRTLDDTRYASRIDSDGRLDVATATEVRIAGSGGDRLRFTVRFTPDPQPGANPGVPESIDATARHWRDFWTKGAAVDFTGSTDARAPELERRVVLSQYLSAINGAGTLPPQEEGLFSNSWYGKFHLEMHPWHAAWQATWSHPDLLARAMPWYVAHLPQARAEAARHRVPGAWWPKMVGPEGRNSPSLVSPFLMWQQPHPILLAELLWRANRDDAVLARYGEVVEATADLLAHWPLDKGGRLQLGPPLIPAQENYDPLTTRDPTFEVEYFRWGLTTAQAWRQRRGQPRKPEWDRALERIAPPPVRDGLYLPAASVPGFWRDAQSPGCCGTAAGPSCKNRDHPSFLMAYGFIPGARIDRETMRRTLAAMEATWDRRQTWGWDFPMIAMTAARLGEPDKAIDWLFASTKNNQWGPTGMTPRVHLDEHAEDLVPAIGGAGGVAMAHNPDGPGYRRAAEAYFPSNGSLLLAVGMMAGGWDGSRGPAPGFPKRGWTVRAEGLAPTP